MIEQTEKDSRISLEQANHVDTRFACTGSRLRAVGDGLGVLSVQEAFMRHAPAHARFAHSNVWVLASWPAKLVILFSVGYLRGATRLVS